MFFEDVTVGYDELGAFTFTAPDIKHFAARFDPQPFHMDEAAARTEPFRRPWSPPAGRSRPCGCA